MDYDTELNSWFIVNFMDKDNKILLRILWGIIEKDKKHRFIKDQYVSTSEIISIINDEYVKTLNTTYKIQKNKGDIISLPGTYLTHALLKKGFSPLHIKKMYQLQQIH
jgi:hypothetical protein